MRPPYITRRQLLRTSGSALLAMNLWPGALAYADAPAEDFEFIAANDLHYADDKCAKYFELVRAAIAKESPKSELCLALGDMADRNRVAQLAGMRDVLKTWKLDCKVVRGNHDWAVTPDEEHVEGKSFEQIYPRSLNYTFDYRGWQFIGLDSTEGPLWQFVNMQPATFAWLDQNLKKLDRRKPTVVFTHVSPGEKTPAIYRLKNGDALLERFKEFNLRAILCGHYHGQSESARSDILITTSQCCSRAGMNHDDTDEKGFFVCSAKGGKVPKRFVEVKVPAGLEE